MNSFKDWIVLRIEFEYYITWFYPRKIGFKQNKKIVEYFYKRAGIAHISAMLRLHFCLLRNFCIISLITKLWCSTKPLDNGDLAPVVTILIPQLSVSSKSSWLLNPPLLSTKNLSVVSQTATQFLKIVFRIVDGVLLGICDAADRRVAWSFRWIIKQLKYFG